MRPTPPPKHGTVYALGLSDALRVDLQPCQRAGFIDELDALWEPLGEALEHARKEWEALVRVDNTSPVAVAAEEKVLHAAYAVRVARAIRSQAPARSTDAAFSIVGPATTISTIIAGAACHAADVLAESLRTRERCGVEAGEQLRQLALAASVWVDTLVDCESIEWYRFDADWDPVAAIP